MSSVKSTRCTAKPRLSQARFASAGFAKKGDVNRIASAWTAENGVFTWTVLVPVNASATASVPTSDPASVRVENAAGGDAGLQGTETDGRVEFEIGSGVWTFTSKL